MVEGGLRAEAFGERRAGALEDDLVPADVRELQPARLEPRTSPRRIASPSAPPSSLECSNGELHAEADPEDRRTCLRALVQQLVESELAQVRHRARERAHAGQHESVRAAQLVGSPLMSALAPTCSSAFSTERRLPMP